MQGVWVQSLVGSEGGKCSGGVAKKKPNITSEEVAGLHWTIIIFPEASNFGPSSVHLLYIWSSCLRDNPPKSSLLQETCLVPSSPAHTWTWSDHYSLEHWAVPGVIWEYRGCCRLQGCIFDSSVPDPAHQGHQGQDSAHPGKLVHRAAQSREMGQEWTTWPMFLSLLLVKLTNQQPSYLKAEWFLCDLKLKFMVNIITISPWKSHRTVMT